MTVYLRCRSYLFDNKIVDNIFVNVLLLIIALIKCKAIQLLFFAQVELFGFKLQVHSKIIEIVSFKSSARIVFMFYSHYYS